MPLPEGRYHAYEDTARVQWREDNADLIAFCTEDSPLRFVREMADNIRYYGSLTSAQEGAIRNIMAASSDRMVDGIGTWDAAPTAEATADDLPEIFNGVYTLNDGSFHITYRIHTVRRGPLEGKRIIKVQHEYQNASGFAFLTTDCRVKVWRRFAEDERRNERYIVWARILVEILRAEVSADGNSRMEPFTTWSQDDVSFEVQRSLTCRRCNRELTNPSSIDAGLGPECAQRVADRTTAARQHESVSTTGAVACTGEGCVLCPPGTHQARVIPEVIPVSISEDRQEADVAPPYPTEAELIRARNVQRRRHEQGQTEDRTFQDLYRRLNISDRARCCGDCGRLFQSRAGVSRHRSHCQGRIANLTITAQAQQTRLQALAADRIANPNRSALGTRIDGEVWLQ